MLDEVRDTNKQPAAIGVYFHLDCSSATLLSQPST